MGLSLAGLYIFFLIGGHVTGIPVLCGFSAAFLHFFMLVFFAWTAVEAIWLYIKLVKVFGTHSVENLYIVKSGIPAWGEHYNFELAVVIFDAPENYFGIVIPSIVIPFLIVAFSAGLGHNYYISSF